MGRITINGNVFDIEGDGMVIQNSNGTIRVNGKVVGSNLTNTVELKIEGAIASVESDGSVECGDVQGSVSAGSSVTCRDVGSSVSAGSSVSCNNVNGNISAGSSIKAAGYAGGKISAGGSVRIEK